MDDNIEIKHLKKSIKKAKTVFLMAHKNLDLDAIGSCLGMYYILSNLKKDCYIIIDDKDNSFIQNIQVKENKEELRLLQLRQQYENGEIFEEDMSDEDIDELCKIYEKETDELNNDTLRRKNHIAEMLKELKNS